MKTMKDVAERARVSVSTVSHVLNGTRKVSEGTRGDVLAAVEELAYRPNLLAKGLKTRRTYTIGLLIPDIQNSFFTSIVRGLEDVALSRGYHLFLCNTDEDLSPPWRRIASPSRRYRLCRTPTTHPWRGACISASFRCWEWRWERCSSSMPWQKIASRMASTRGCLPRLP